MSQRPLRRRGRTAFISGRIVSVVAALAIVGATGTDTAVLARTPSTDFVRPAPARERFQARIDRPVVDLLTMVPTVGLLRLPEPEPVSATSLAFGLAPAAELDADALAAWWSGIGIPPRASGRDGVRPERRPKPDVRPKADQKPDRKADRESQRDREPRRDRPRIVGLSRWHVAPSATWYGPGLYGNQTACGHVYTRRIVGVAHRTLPCGSLVQLQWRGMSVVVPVIDRGPFGHPSNVFDFSARLACDVLRPNGAKNGCFTRHHVRWREVDRRR